jgi:hypothetical protein
LIEKIKEKYKGQKIAIIGNGGTAKHKNGTFLDFSELYENIWTVNGGWIHHKTSSLGFTMHDYEASIQEDPELHEKTINAIQKSGIPIIVPKKYKDCPTTVTYPLKEAYELGGWCYFAETISYMTVFAILCGVTEIFYHGADYIGIRANERACLEYWIRAAQERGIRINVDIGSTLLTSPAINKYYNVHGFYGYTKENFPYEIEELEGNIFKFNFNRRKNG